MAQLVLPRVQAMVLCDDVVESEEEAGVFHLNGVRSVIWAPSFPAVISLCAFLHLSGHQGEASCSIAVESWDSGQIISDTESQLIVFEDPSIVVPEYFRVPDCVFASPGVYFVQAHANGKLIGERRLHLVSEE